nr:hypothetical protein [Tanacetum cinerariifolium]GFA12811.1 hypothetical protein [Tanacetum cinerariifolium]
MLGVFKSGVHQICHDARARCHIHSGDIIDWDFLASQGLAQAFFESINKDPFSGPQWVDLFQANENVYRELVHEFFALFEFDASFCRQSRDIATLSGLRKGAIVKANHFLLGFWPTIGDEGFNVGNTKVVAIRDPRVKLAHRYLRVVCTKYATMLVLDATFTLGTSLIGISLPAKVLLKPSSSLSTKTLSLAPNGLTSSKPMRM